MSLIIHFPEQKICYFAIPKAGNTTVKRFLSPLITGEEPRDHTNIHRELDWNTINHRTYDSLDLTGYLTFTVVRNPWERIFSAYKDKVVRRLHAPLEKAGLSADASLLDFAEFCASRDDESLDVHLRPQSWFIKAEQRFLRKPTALPDHVIDINDMPRVATLVRSHVPDFEYDPIGKTNENKTVTKPIVDFLSSDPKLAAKQMRQFNSIVAKRYADDVALFGYRSPYR